MSGICEPFDEKFTEPEIMTEEEFLTKNGASAYDMCEPGLHKANTRMSKGQWNRLCKNHLESMDDLIDRREELREEYKNKVLNGEIRPPNRKEKLLADASGHEDNESTWAARRILQKRYGITIGA